MDDLAQAAVHDLPVHNKAFMVSFTCPTRPIWTAARLLLSKDFVVLVVISLLIATPLAYLFMDNWLEHYQYHAALSWWIFAAAGLGALLITLLTVSYQSIRAALMNPTRSLRSE